MKVLFDQGTPVPLRAALVGHEVHSAFERGWSELKNGELLAAAENDGFDVLVTTDQSFRYQQNLVGRRIAIVVLSTTNWRRIRPHAHIVAAALENVTSAAFVEVQIPST